MKKKGFIPGQIITMLREAEVLLSQGSTVVEVAKRLTVTEQTYNRWRRVLMERLTLRSGTMTGGGAWLGDALGSKKKPSGEAVTEWERAPQPRKRRMPSIISPPPFQTLPRT
jgi:transposase-like protein